MQEKMTRLVVSGSVVWWLVACASDATLGYGDEAQRSAANTTGGTAGSEEGQEALAGTYSTDSVRPPPVDPPLLAAGTVPPGCEQRHEPFNPTISYRGYIQGFEGQAQLGRTWPSEVVILKFTELTTSAVSGRVLSDQAGAGNYGTPGPDPEGWGGYWIVGAEGFQYTMTEGSFDGQRLRFTVNLYEPMCAWCGQQTPYEVTSSGVIFYQCAPDFDTAHFEPGNCTLLPIGASEWQTWDCASMSACTILGLMCDCSADGCTALSSPSGVPIAFDLALVGDQLIGSAGSLGNAILTRETS